MDEFCLINIACPDLSGNGRFYSLSRINLGKPEIARMLSPDNYVQAPDFTQNFNRYSYCLNNPLKYTDPSGNNYVSDMYHGNNGGGSYMIGFGSPNLSRHMGDHLNFLSYNDYPSGSTYVTDGKGNGALVDSKDYLTGNAVAEYLASEYDITFYVPVYGWTDIDCLGYHVYKYEFLRFQAVDVGQDGGGNVQEANLTDALPLSVAIGSMLAEIAPTATLLLSQVAGILTLLTIPGDNRIDTYTENPVFGPRENWSTGRGNQTNCPIKINNNGNFPDEVPWWFMPFAVGAGAFDIYQNNWPRPNMPDIPKPKKYPIIVPYRH